MGHHSKPTPLKDFFQTKVLTANISIMSMLREHSSIGCRGIFGILFDMERPRML